MPHSINTKTFHVFTTIRIYQNKPLFLKEHLDRLERDASAFGLPYPETVTPEFFAEKYPGPKAQFSYVDDMGMMENANQIKLSPTKNSAPWVPDISSKFRDDNNNYLLKIAIYKNKFEITPRDIKPIKENQNKIIISSQFVNPKYAQHKTSMREPYDLAYKEALNQNACEALVWGKINNKDYITDGTRSSYFLINSEKKLIIQPVGGLPSITRKILIKKIIQNNPEFELTYQKISNQTLDNHLKNNCKIFLAGSGIGITQVKTLN